MSCKSTSKHISEGVSRRRAKRGVEYVHDIHYILTRYLGFAVHRSKGSHVQYKRDEDGSTVGIINYKKVSKGSTTGGSDFKRILGAAFWWADAMERDDLWTLARQTKGKDPRLMPPDRQDPTTMHGVTAMEKKDIPSFKVFFEMSGLPQNMKGGSDKYHPKVQRALWKSIIDNIQSQLPREYRNLRYVGPFPPTDAPLFSIKRSDEVQRVHLFFGHHKHDPEDRIRVDIGRRNLGNNKSNWVIISISAN